MTCSTEMAGVIYCNICFQSFSHPPLVTLELAHAFPVVFKCRGINCIGEATAQRTRMRMEPHCLFPRLSAWPMRGTLVLQLNSPKDLSLSLSRKMKNSSPPPPPHECASHSGVERTAERFLSLSLPRPYLNHGGSH